jgi:hypothetical protein
VLSESVRKSGTNSENLMIFENFNFQKSIDIIYQFY